MPPLITLASIKNLADIDPVFQDIEHGFVGRKPDYIRDFLRRKTARSIDVENLFNLFRFFLAND